MTKEMAEKMLSRTKEKGRAWAAAEHFSGDLATFVIFIVLARLLYPADYGAISLAVVLAALGTALVQNAVGPARSGETEAAERSTAFLLRLVLGLLLCGAFWLLAGPLEALFPLPELAKLLRALSFLPPLAALRVELSTHAEREGLQKRSFLASLVGTAASLLLGLILARRGFGVWALAAQLLSKAALDVPLQALALRWRPGFCVSSHGVRALLRREGADRWTGLLELFCFQLPCLLIGARCAPEALAYYTRGQRDPEIVAKALDAAAEALPPKEEGTLPRLRERLLTGCCLSFPALLGLMAVAAPVASWILTERWLPFVPYLRVFCVLFLAQAVRQPCLAALREAGRERAARLLRLLHGALAAVLLGLAWAQGADALWLAVLSAAASWAAALAALALSARLLGYGAGEQARDLLPSLLLSLLMAGAVYTLASLLTGAGAAPVLAAGAGIVLGVVLYGGLGLLLRLPGLRLLLKRVTERLRR